MIDERAIRVADAVMYEGAFLYPYRRSSLKNQQRWTFGVLPPRSATELSAACLLRGEAHAAVEVLLRFLTDDHEQLRPREVRSRNATGFERIAFVFGELTGALTLERTALGDGYERLRACVQNCTVVDERAAPTRDHERARSLHGVHVLLRVGPTAHFVSLTDPPPEAELYAAHCEGQGLWCTVLGRDRARPDTALVAPMILPDFPQVAPESCAELGDATEIDEMLALRIQTLSEAERREARETDPWVRKLIDRVEALTDAQRMRLHGARRGSLDSAPELLGARVRLTPRRAADAMDMLLAGRVALVCDVECSVDGEVLLGVTLEDDPGRDLGSHGMPGHRFFFGLDEVQLLEEGNAMKP